MPKIELIPTGVPGLDDVLGGGLPDLSFNILSGTPGSGKTTLAHQIVFGNATVERPALYCTVVGEPPFKMFRHQQQFDFYDVEKVGRAVHFRNFATEVAENDFEGILEAILGQVEELEPGLVVVDSFPSAVFTSGRGRSGKNGKMYGFMQQLSNRMATWEATSFLLGEFGAADADADPVFAVADSLLWLRNVEADETRVRKLEVAKMRGGAELPGQHLYRISARGVRIYPRLIRPLPERAPALGDTPRLSTGVAAVDAMTGGGFQPADVVMLSGPSGSGKSLFGMHFAKAGLEAGEAVVFALFEETVDRYILRAAALGCDLVAAQEEGKALLLRRNPLDLGLDETLGEIRDAVVKTGARRVVLDSLTGLQISAYGAHELKLLRQAVGRVVEVLSEAGVTVLITAELQQASEVLSFTPHGTSYLADNLIIQRYVEIEGHLEAVMAVVKMRRSSHSRAFHRYGITEKGLVVGEPLKHLQGILSGVPRVVGEPMRRDGDWEEVEALNGGSNRTGDVPSAERREDGG